MAKQSGKDNSQVDAYVLSMGREDSWKGTPLDDEEEQLKKEPTTTGDNRDASPPNGKIESIPSPEKASKLIEIPVDDIQDNGKKLGKSPFPRVCAPTQRELQAFKKPPPPLPLPSAASGEASIPKLSNPVTSFPTIKEVESTGEKELTPVTVPLPPQVQLSVPVATEGGGGNGARKELEDAIQRIEAHIKNEQAARRTAESALAQARQQSQDTSPAMQLVAAAPNPSFAELQVALEDLSNAQLAVQRAHAVVAYLLSQQQQQQQQHSQRPAGSGKAFNSTKESDLSSPGIHHAAPNCSPSFSSQLQLPALDSTTTTTTAVRDSLPASPTLAKVITKDRGMSWTAGGPKDSCNKQNVTLPSLKVNSLRKKVSNTLPGSPSPSIKTATTPLSSKRSDSGGLSTPTRGSGRGVNSPMASSSPSSPEWNNDRFATGKAEAFMINQAARWNSKGK